MTPGFVHSIKVPRLYKTAAKILQEVDANRASIKTLIYKQKHPNVSALYSLCSNALKRREQLNRILNKTRLLLNESRLDPWLARILITELLWGKKVLNTGCKPAQTVRFYEKQLKEALSDLDGTGVVETPINKVQKPRYVRINTLLLPLERGISYFEEEGWTLLPKCSNYTEHLEVVKDLQEPHFIQDFHVLELLVFPAGTIFHNNSKYLAGEFILQDKASCLPAKLLNVKPGSVVLDMCAAPGMKSTQTAALMNNSGKIYAVEIDEDRYGSLCEQVKMTGASCIEPILKDALSLEGNEYSDVEYILVDPSCSGSGMLERQAIYGKEKSDPTRLKTLQSFQVFLLRHALLNFPNVKRVVYSTCSIQEEENEQVVDEILGDVSGAYELVNLKELLKENWLHYSWDKYECSSKCIYSISEIDLCNGFFVAVFERNSSVPLPPYRRKGADGTNIEQSKEDDMSIIKEVPAKRKRKKRGKRRSMNFVETSIEESTPKVSSPLNVSTDSITIIDEMIESEVEEIDPEPVTKQKKIVSKVKKQVNEKTLLKKNKKVEKLSKKAKKR